MKIKLAYGETWLESEIEDRRILHVITTGEDEVQVCGSPRELVEQALSRPTGSLPFEELVESRDPETVVIIVNDITRPTPTRELLGPLLSRLSGQGIDREQITLVIATGTHRPHSEEDNIRVFGREIAEKYRILSHDSGGDLEYVGKLPDGNPLYLNRTVASADLLLATGVILPHYFAGFSGGRKSILPGVAGEESISRNHALAPEVLASEPPLKENPIHREMMAAARISGLDFILNAVTNSSREIVKVVAGDYQKAWEEGVAVSRDLYEVEVDEKADLTVVSAGGFPRDIDIYQAQKALEHAWRVTREGGVIVLAAESRDGLANPTFARWMREAQDPRDILERIEREFFIGAHKAFAIAHTVIHCEVVVVSELTDRQAESLFFTPKQGLDEALEYAASRLPDDYTVNLMPHGCLTVPEVKR